MTIYIAYKSEIREMTENQNSYKQSIIGDVNCLTDRWNEKAEEFIKKQKINPFSGRYNDNERQRWVKGSKDYACPVGKTAERAEKARKHINKELDTLCCVIEMMGNVDENGNLYTTFGELFERYTRISSKVVGLLLRARKHNLVQFSGEMLWQRRDDDVKIILCDER